MTTQRERFEAWAKSADEIDLHRLASGEYSNPYTEDAWAAWQEAERQAIERYATLCYEKSAYARLHGGAQNGAAMAQMLGDDIRAMGDEDDPE